MSNSPVDRTEDPVAANRVKELERYIDSLRKEHQIMINGLDAAIKQLKFRAAVAEWAVAGVLAHNTHVNVSVPFDSKQEAVDLVGAIGRNAGAYFLRQAELAFRQHAEHCELMAKVPPHKHYRPTIEESVPPPIMWPRPFK